MPVSPGDEPGFDNRDITGRRLSSWILAVLADVARRTVSLAVNIAAVAIVVLAILYLSALIHR